MEKKFFLDNQLPRPEPKDLAENDAGLPPAQPQRPRGLCGDLVQAGRVGHLREMRLAAAAPAGASGRAARGPRCHHHQGLQAMPRQPLGASARRHSGAAAGAVDEDGPEAAAVGDRRGAAQEGQQRLPHQVRHDAPALVRAARGGQDRQGRSELFLVGRLARSGRAASARSSSGPTTTSRARRLTAPMASSSRSTRSSSASGRPPATRSATCRCSSSRRPGSSARCGPRCTGAGRCARRWSGPRTSAGCSATGTARCSTRTATRRRPAGFRV